MAYEALDAHLHGLGAKSRSSPGDAGWAEIGVEPATPVGELLRWLVGRFGGSSFGMSASFRRPSTGQDVLLGWILDGPEISEILTDLDGVLPPDLIPFENDGADNHLLAGVGAGNSGQVFRHLHDAPTDRNLELISDSLEQFLSALHPGE